MGSMFGNLTKTAVGDKYYDSAPQAAQAAGQGASLYTPDLSGQQMGESNPIPVTKAPDPVISKPSFNEVRDNPEAQTTKGQVLGLVFSAAQGAGIGAGQKDFGGGFRAETEFLKDQEDRKIRNKALATEDALKQIEIQQRPMVFAKQQSLINSEIGKNNAMTELYGDRGDRAGYINVPGVGLVKLGDNAAPQTVVKAPEKPVALPKTDAELRIMAAKGDKDAIAALAGKTKDAKDIKGAPSGSGSNHVHGQATVAASQFLQKHKGDAEAAIADFQAQLPAAIAKNPAVEDAAPFIIQEIKKAGKKKSSKLALQFATTGK